MKKYYRDLSAPACIDSSRQLRTYLNDKPRDRIRILLTRQEAKSVADDFHKCANEYGAEVPRPKAEKKPEV